MHSFLRYACATVIALAKLGSRCVTESLLVYLLCNMLERWEAVYLDELSDICLRNNGWNPGSPTSFLITPYSQENLWLSGQVRKLTKTTNCFPHDELTRTPILLLPSSGVKMFLHTALSTSRSSQTTQITGIFLHRGLHFSLFLASAQESLNHLLGDGGGEQSENFDLA